MTISISVTASNCVAKIVTSDENGFETTSTLTNESAALVIAQDQHLISIQHLPLEKIADDAGLGTATEATE